MGENLMLGILKSSWVEKEGDNTRYEVKNLTHYLQVINLVTATTIYT